MGTDQAPDQNVAIHRPGIVTRADIETLAAWFAKQWPAASPISIDSWAYGLSSHQVRHLRYACEVFATMAGGLAPTFAEFHLAAMMIGEEIGVARTLVLGGPDAWTQFLADRALAKERTAARLAAQDDQQSLF